MNPGPALCLAILLGTGPAPAEPPVAIARPRVENASGLPVHTYALQGSASDVAQDRKAVLALAAQIERDLKADLETFDIQDKASLSSIHTSLYVIAMLKEDASSAARHLQEVRELRDQGLTRLMTGLFTGPLIEAWKAPGNDLHATYRKLLSKALMELPFKDAEKALDRARTGQKSASKEQILGSLAATVDPTVKDGQLMEDGAGAILGAALNLHVTLPMKADVVACLDALFEAHKLDAKAEKPARTPIKSTLIQAKGPYFGQSLPGEKPVLFAPEVLKAVSPWVSGIAFSPDGQECFLHVGDANYTGAHIYQTTCVKGEWTPLVEPAFLKGFALSSEPVYSRDGQTLIFTGKKEGSTTDFWSVSRKGKDWSAPVAMAAPFNSEANEFRGSFTLEGCFYFGSERASAGINQVFKATPDKSQGWKVEKLSAPVNALSYDGDPCIAPDGRFLIYYAGRTRGYGRVDLHVTFPDGKGGWTNPLNLGPDFNSADDEFGACLSHDGKYLFFTRHTAEGDKLFWVSVSAIDKLNASPQGTKPPSPAAYCGQTPPGETPLPFAAELLAPKGEFIGNAAFTPDGREFYYTVTNEAWNAFELRCTRFLDGSWTAPTKPAFVEHPLSLEPAVTPDGQRIYFSSGTWADLDIWFCDRAGDAWAKPTRLADMTGARGMKMFPSISRKGTLLFGMEDEKGGRTYMTKVDGSRWTSASPFDAHFNLPKQIGDPFISPNEDYLIFQAERPGGLGQADLYISFRKPKGGWTEPQNLGPQINTEAFEFGPALTPDGKYFLFSRRKAWKTQVPSRIYWVKADFIERLRPTDLAEAPKTVS